MLLICDVITRKRLFLYASTSCPPFFGSAFVTCSCPPCGPAYINGTASSGGNLLSASISFPTAWLICPSDSGSHRVSPGTHLLRAQLTDEKVISRWTFPPWLPKTLRGRGSNYDLLPSPLPRYRRMNNCSIIYLYLIEQKQRTA